MTPFGFGSINGVSSEEVYGISHQQIGEFDNKENEETMR